GRTRRRPSHLGSGPGRGTGCAVEPTGTRLPRLPRRPDDLRQPLRRTPTEELVDATRVAHELRRVARAARQDLRRDVEPAHAPDLVDDLAHRRALTGADVEHVERALRGVEVLQRREVRLREVEHVNVVADARAVRRRVVVPEDLGALAALEPVEDHRHEVEHGRVAELRPARAGDVEVAQRDEPQPPRAAGRAAEPLADELRLAVRVDRLGVQLLLDERDRRHAVRRGRRREHEAVHACRLHRRDEVREAADVLLVVPGRLLDRLAHLLARREVDHGPDLVLGERARQDVHGLGRGHVDLDERRVADAVGTAGAEVVDHDHLLAALLQEAHHVRADVPGSAGHEDRHGTHPSGAARAPGGRRRDGPRPRRRYAWPCASRSRRAAVSSWNVECSTETGKWCATHVRTRSTISSACPSRKHASSTTTCAEIVGRPVATVEACRSCTSSTWSSERMCARTSSRSSPSGVNSMSTAVASRRSRNARGTMSAAMTRAAIVSARWYPVVAMTTAATMTPTDPSASLTTSRNAARRLRFARRPDASTAIATTFPTSPTTPNTSSSDEGTSGGATSRRTPSTTAYTPTASRSAACASAASTSTRRKPHVRRLVAGRSA